MKKKIALLLALTMIVSILPMNVFGKTTLDVPVRNSGFRLPATVVDRVRIDLADLEGDTPTNGKFVANGPTGYAIDLTLDGDAFFGINQDDDFGPYYYDGNDFFPEDEDITYGSNNSDNLKRVISYVNVMEGLWSDAGADSPSPARQYVYNGGNNGSGTVYDNVADLPLSAIGTAFEDIVKDYVDNGAPVSGAGLALGSAPVEEKAADLWTSAGTDDIEWAQLNAFFETTLTSPTGYQAPVALTVTYDYEVLDDDQIRLYVQLFNQSGGTMSVPDDLDTGEIFIDFAVPIRLDDTTDGYNATLTVTDRQVSGSDLGTSTHGVIKDLEPEVTVKVDEAASFNTTGFLDTVTIDESVPNFIRGDSTGPMVVEMRMDSDHAWLMENAREKLNFSDEKGTFHDSTNGLNSQAAYETLGYFGGDNNEDDRTYETDYDFYYEIGNRDRFINDDDDNDSDTDYDVRFVFPGVAPGEGSAADVDDFLTDGNDLMAPTDPRNDDARYDVIDSADSLYIHNLMVGFDDRQNYDVDLPIEYRVYYADGASRSYVTDDGEDGWVSTDSVAASRKTDTVQLDVLDGRLGAVDADGPDAVVSGKRRAETSPFRISETVNGTWDTGSLVMAVGDGVEIMGAHVSVYEYDFEVYDTADRVEDNTRVESTTWDVSINSSNDDNWTYDGDTGNEDEEYLDVARHQDYYNNGGIKITNKEITFDPRMSQITPSGERREIEVQLEVSIEAGYVQKGRNTVDPTAIDIAFSGPGAANFEASSLTVARVHDAITVSAPAAITPDVNWETTAYENVIGDITVTEGAAGDLEQDDEIWLYVVGDRQIDLTLDAGRKPIVSNQAESGLELYDGVQLRHTFGNFWLSGVRYNVRRESGFANTSAPAVITFEDVTISGAMYQGASYAIVISGNAVAENDYTVWANDLGYVTNPGTRDTYDYADYNDATNEAGIFDAEEPYLIEAINWDEVNYSTPPVTEEAPPTDEPDEPPVVVVARTPQEFGPYSYSTDETGTFNNFYMALASNGEGYAGISPRGFAQFIGGETVFDPATSTATVTGKDNNGVDTVVTLTIGSTNATVNGQTVDIATYNEHPGYPAGSIMPFMPAGVSRTYLPIRFLCKAFGVPFNWNPTTASVTLY